MDNLGSINSFYAAESVSVNRWIHGPVTLGLRSNSWPMGWGAWTKTIFFCCFFKRMNSYEYVEFIVRKEALWNIIKYQQTYTYLGKLQYFLNLNSSAICGWFTWLTIYGFRSSPSQNLPKPAGSHFFFAYADTRQSSQCGAISLAVTSQMARWRTVSGSKCGKVGV